MSAFEDWWDKENLGPDTSWRRCWNAALRHAVEVCKTVPTDGDAADCYEAILKEIES